MTYKEIEYWDNHDPKLFAAADWNHNPSLSQLAAQSQKAEMKLFTPEDVKSHVAGVAVVTSHTMNDEHFTAVTAYAGITGMIEVRWMDLAEIGSVIRHDAFRGMGYGFMAVAQLIEIASTTEMQALLGHDGFAAKCNEASSELFEMLGFTSLDWIEDKEIMYLPLVQ